MDTDPELQPEGDIWKILFSFQDLSKRLKAVANATATTLLGLGLWVAIHAALGLSSYMQVKHLVAVAWLAFSLGSILSLRSLGLGLLAVFPVAGAVAIPITLLSLPFGVPQGVVVVLVACATVYAVAGLPSTGIGGNLFPLMLGVLVVVIACSELFWSPPGPSR